ncbi:MAG: secretin N-terminal domain-containing protein [bacterium]
MWHSRAPRLAVLSACLALILALPSLGSTAVAAPKRVTAVTVKDFGSKLVIGIVATGTIVYQVTEVTTPPPLRVVVDILDAVVDDEIRTTTEVDRGPVSRVRVGQFQDSPAIARVVIDLTAPLKVDVAKTSATTLAVSVPLTGSPPAAAAPPKPAPAAQLPAPSKPAVAQAPPAPQPVPAPAPAVAQAPPAAVPPSGVIRLLEFRGVPLPDVLSALARLCGWNIVTDASVQGSITLRLVNVTCEEALRFILEANNLGFRRIGNNLIITSAERLQPPAEVPETIAYRLAFGDVNAIRAAIAAAVPGIRVAVDPRTNSLLITATAAQHEEVRKVLATLDIRIQQVMIQVHAIEVNRSSVTDLGLLDSGLDATLGRIGFDAVLGRVFFALQDATLLLIRLRALIDQRNGRVLASPRVATLDGNRASILLGDQFPVIQTVPGAVAGTTTQTVTFVPVGVKLEVTPRINADGLMTVNIKPEVSSVVEIITTTQGTRAPRIATRSAETTLTVADGQSIVMGGLISQEERRTVLKVPLLGDIPILGELFKFTTVDVRNTELIFVITPTILKD